MNDFPGRLARQDNLRCYVERRVVFTDIYC